MPDRPNRRPLKRQKPRVVTRGYGLWLSLPAAAAAAAAVMLGGLLRPIRRAELLEFADGLPGLHGGQHGIDPGLNVWVDELSRTRFVSSSRQGMVVGVKDRTRNRHEISEQPIGGSRREFPAALGRPTAAAP